MLRSACPLFHLTKRFSHGCNIVVNRQNDIGLKCINLSNVKKRNVLSLETINELNSEIYDQDNIRCILLKADGPVFSAGHDLEELLTDKSSQIFKSMSELCMKIRSIPVPVVAAVNGAAVAAGAQLIASCDIVVASTKSSFACPGINVGLFCSTPAVAVSRSCNIKVTSFMLFTGQSINAQQALESGLVTFVSEVDTLDSKIDSIVNGICSKDKKVLALGKKLLLQQSSLDLTQAYEMASQTMMNNLTVS